MNRRRMRSCLALFAPALLLSCGAPAPRESTSIPGGGVFIRNATVIDGTGAAPKPATHILLRGSTIEAMGADLRAPSGATVVDASGKFIMPGIIDTHIHLDAPMVFQLTAEERQQIVDHTGTALLYNGVTTVLNVSSEVDWIWERRDAQREGRILSPRIYATGRSFTPEGGWGSRHPGAALANVEEATKRALDYVAKGADGFKIVIEDGLGGSGTYKMMDDAMLEAIAEIAHRESLPIYVHAINLDEYKKALEIEPRAIVHGLEDPIREGDDLLEQLVQRNVAVAPTLSLWESFLGYDETPQGFDDPVLRGSVPAFLLDKMRTPEFMQEENRRFKEVARIEVYDWVREAIPIFRETTLRMHRAGVTLAVGTDAGGPVGYNFQGYNTPWELILLVEAGLTPMEAIVAATRNGAQVIGVEEKLGTLEPGKLADLLILEANPLDDIRNVRKIEMVVLDGKVHERRAFEAPQSKPSSN